MLYVGWHANGFYDLCAMRLDIRRTSRDTLFAFVAAGVAWAATVALYRFDHILAVQGVMAFFIAAVVVAAWRGGIIAALVCTLLSVLIGAWILPPNHSFHISETEDIIRLFLFLFVACLISYLQYARQRAERSLKESEGRLNFSLDSSGVACWDVNVKNATFWKSHNLPGVFGRTEADFATTYEGFFAYIYPEDRDFFSLASVGSGSDERDYEISHRIICGDSTVRRVSTRGKMYFDNQGRVERMVGAVFAVDDKLLTPAKSGRSVGSALTDTASYPT
jgi:PAS domain-containing protein